jgi:hypothetical protein
MRYTTIWLLVLLLALSTTSAYAQNDYVVINKNDTIRGSLEPIYKAYPKLISGSKTIWCHPSIVKSYFNSKKGSLYRSVMMTGAEEPIFLQILETGKINLYEWEYSYDNTGTTTTSITWYADKAGYPLKEVKRTGVGGNASARKVAMEFLLSDNGPIAQEFINKETYSFDYLRATIRKYNAEAK